MPACVTCGTDHTLHVVPGPNKVLRREDAGERWCFGCRRRLPHTDVLLTDDMPEGEYSWYEPVWVRRCSRCNRDLTNFPGSVL